jgi:uncharacterized protein (DUF1697 family)
MALVVFLRGVNVGGNRTFRPSVLAQQLEAVNVGAAGTFVVKRAVGVATLRREIRKRLAFDAEVMICPAAEISAILGTPPFGTRAPAEGVRWFVSVMAEAPAEPLTFPLERPSGVGWQVKVIGAKRRYAFSLWRPRPRQLLYPNEVIEKSCGVAATTRGWPTLLTIGKVLAAR